MKSCFRIIKIITKNGNFPSYYTISEVLIDTNSEIVPFIENNANLFFLEEDHKTNIQQYFLDQLELIKQDIINSPILIAYEE